MVGTVSGFQRGFWGAKLRFSGMHGKGFYPLRHHGSPKVAFEIGPGGTPTHNPSTGEVGSQSTVWAVY